MPALAARTAVIAGYLVALVWAAPLDVAAALLATALAAVWAMPPLCRRCRRRPARPEPTGLSPHR